MSDEQAPDGAPELRAMALDTLHAWLPKHPVEWDGWRLELVARNERTGYLVYDLLPHSPDTWHEVPRRFAVRVSVEELSVRELPRD